jgi:predicted small secreted protein
MRDAEAPSEFVSITFNRTIMKKHFLLIIAIALFVAFAFTSCDTATGQGAGWGATTGAILGAAATGDVRGAAVGALIGANTGALIGASIDEAEAVRYGPRPRGGFPFARPTETRGLDRVSPCQFYFARSASTIACASSVIFSSSGQER